MKFPFFAVTILLTIFCAIMFIKALDYGQGWAIGLAVLMLLTFAVLSIIALLYQMRQHEQSKSHHHHH